MPEGYFNEHIKIIDFHVCTYCVLVIYIHRLIQSLMSTEEKLFQKQDIL